MSTLADGYGGYLVLVLVALLAHEPWRWLGLALGTQVDANGELFRWVKAVATALVAGLVARILIYPPGVLAGIASWARVAALLGGIAIFYLARRNLAAGLIGGAGLMILGAWATGGQ